MQEFTVESSNLWLIFLQSGLTALAYFFIVWNIADRKKKNIISFIAYAILNGFAVSLLILILKSKFQIGFLGIFAIDLCYFGVMTKTPLLSHMLKE
jgi:hypothetical protein